MAYTDRRTDPRRRATAVAGVVAIHAALAGIVIAGLSVVTIIQDDPNIIGFDLDPPPPPPPPPPVPQPSDQVAPLPKAPMPPIPLPPQPGPEVDFRPIDEILPTPTFPVIPPTPGPAVQPDPPRPVPSFSPKLARPANGPSGWVTSDDYPSQELRAGIEGQLRYRLSVASNGRVTACEIVATSGAKRLDEAACRMITRRARFDAATDDSGAKVVGTYSGTVRWEIPD